MHQRCYICEDIVANDVSKYEVLAGTVKYWAKWAE